MFTIQMQVFVMLALWWMQVPLTIALSSVLIADLSLCSAFGAEVWGLVTFVTNFIPNLGTKGS